MTAPYLGHLVRLKVPMQGHVSGVASAAGTLSDAEGVFPATITVPISLVFKSEDLRGTGVWYYTHNPSTGDYTFDPEIQAYNQATVRVSAIDINSPDLIVSRGQTDIGVPFDGGRLREWINDPLAEIISYTSFALKNTPAGEFGSPRIAWSKRASYPPTLNHFGAPYNKWGIAFFEDWPGASYDPLGTGEDGFADSLTASNAAGGSATYTANRITSIGTQKYLVYVR
jgi:hypothetical protein